MRVKLACRVRPPTIEPLSFISFFFFLLVARCPVDRTAYDGRTSYFLCVGATDFRKFENSFCDRCALRFNCWNYTGARNASTHSLQRRVLSKKKFRTLSLSLRASFGREGNGGAHARSTPPLPLPPLRRRRSRRSTSGLASRPLSLSLSLGRIRVWAAAACSQAVAWGIARLAPGSLGRRRESSSRERKRRSAASFTSTLLLATTVLHRHERPRGISLLFSGRGFA